MTRRSLRGVWTSSSACSVGEPILPRRGPAMIGMKEWALVLDSCTELLGIGTVANAMAARLTASAQAVGNPGQSGLSRRALGAAVAERDSACDDAGLKHQQEHGCPTGRRMRGRCRPAALSSAHASGSGPGNHGLRGCKKRVEEMWVSWSSCSGLRATLRTAWWATAFEQRDESHSI